MLRNHSNLMTRGVAEPGNSTYVKSLRLRLAYFFSVALALLCAGALGACLQVFFLILGAHEPLLISQIILCVVVSPLIFFMVGILCDEILDLIFDAMDKPPLVSARATITAAFSNNSEPQSRSILRYLHYTLILGFELIPIIFAIVNALQEGVFSFTHFLSGYLFGGIVFVLLIALIYIGSHLFILANKQRQDFMYDLRHALDEAERIDGFGVITRKSLEKFHSVELDQLVVQPDGRKALLWFLCAITVQSIVVLLMSLQNLSYNLGIALTIAAFIAAALAIRNWFPRLLGEGFVALTIMYIVLALVLPGFTRSDFVNRPLQHPSFFENASTSHEADVFYQSANSYVRQPATGMGSAYPLCSLRWGNSQIDWDHRLSALELLSISENIYRRSVEDVENSIVHDFENLRGIKTDVERIEEFETVGRWVSVYFPDLKTRVIGIRGTNTERDHNYNLDMFSTVKIVQLFDSLTPIIGVIPSEGLKRYVASVQIRKWFGLDYSHEILSAKLKTLIQKSEKEGVSVVVTGHSLGGLLAGVVSSQTGVPALAFSPPGQRLNQIRLGIDEHSLYRSMIVVQPEKDVVPRVDEQIGFTQNIVCDKSAHICHLTSATACELYRSCGERLNRVLNFPCL